MVVEIRSRLATNIIFDTVLVSLLSVNYWFLRLQLCHFISAIKICQWWTSDPSFTRHHSRPFQLVTFSHLWY